MGKSILNYTTQISAEKTVSEIQSLLAGAGATSILTEFSDGVLFAISFRISTLFGIMSFRLPASVDKLLLVIEKDRHIPARLKTMEQSSRVAWRIIKDWLEAQLALVRVQMVRMEQVFLPFAQDSEGVTVYERLSDSKFSGLTLTESRK